MTVVHPYDTQVTNGTAGTPVHTEVAPAGPPTPRRGRRAVVVALVALAALVIVVPVVLVALLGTDRPIGVLRPVIGTPTAAAPPAPTAPATGPPPTTGPTATPSAAGLPGHYTMLRLPALARSSYRTSGFALNERGEAVGQSDNADGQARPVLWRNGRVIELPVLAPAPDDYGFAQDINAAGDIAGACGVSGPGQHAVLWHNGVATDLGTLGGDHSFAYAINDRGQIVGTSTTATGETHGFLWENGHLRDLGLPDGTVPRDINNAGQVVGTVDMVDGGKGHAFVWQDGELTRLPVPAGTSSLAYAINSRGEIAGNVIHIDTGAHAVRWYHTTMTPLGVLAHGSASGARAINDLGQIVGSSNLVPHAIDEHPFLWWRGTMHDLTHAGLPDYTAYNVVAINNRGQILADNLLFTPAP